MGEKLADFFTIFSNRFPQIPTNSGIGGHRWSSVGFVVWCELGFKLHPPDTKAGQRESILANQGTLPLTL